MKSKKIPVSGKHRVQKQKNKNFNPLIIADSRAKSQGRYQKIKDIFQYSGGASEAQIYLDYWGVPSPIKDLILAYAEYDALIDGGVA